MPPESTAQPDLSRSPSKELFTERPPAFCSWVARAETSFSGVRVLPSIRSMTRSLSAKLPFPARPGPFCGIDSWVRASRRSATVPAATAASTVYSSFAAAFPPASQAPSDWRVSGIFSLDVTESGSNTRQTVVRDRLEARGSLQPFREGGLEGARLVILQTGRERRPLRLPRRELFGVSVRIELEFLLAPDRRGEGGGKPVVVRSGNRIILVIVAARATDREAEEGGPGRRGHVVELIVAGALELRLGELRGEGPGGEETGRLPRERVVRSHSSPAICQRRRHPTAGRG